MISLLIAFVSFIVTLPLKLFQMGTEITLKAREKAQQLEGSDGAEEGSLGAKLNLAGNRIKKVGETGKKAAETTAKVGKGAVNAGKKAAELALKTLKLTIRLLKMLIALLRTIAVLFTFIGTLVIAIVIIVLIVIIVAACYVAFAFGDGVDFSSLNTQKNQNQQNQQNQQSGYDAANGTTPLTTQSQGQVFGDNSTWTNACKSMFDWYFVNVNTYQTTYDNTYTGKRKGYPCGLFDNRVSVGDDCSAFVTACLAYAGFLGENMGNADSAWGSSRYSDATNTDLLKYFNPYVPDDYLTGKYIPRNGDILAYTGHVEIIAAVPTDPNEPGNCASWSWGKIATSNPVPRASDVSTYLHKMWSTNSHNVAVIWSLKDGVETLYNREVTNYEGGPGQNTSYEIPYKAPVHTKNYTVIEDGKSVTKTYTFTSEEWSKLVMKLNDRENAGDNVLISSYTLEELFNILGKSYPP